MTCYRFKRRLLRTLLQERTQEDLAKWFRVAPPTLYFWRYGKRNGVSPRSRKLVLKRLSQVGFGFDDVFEVCKLRNSK